MKFYISLILTTLHMSCDKVHNFFPEKLLTLRNSNFYYFSTQSPYGHHDSMIIEKASLGV